MQKKLDILQEADQRYEKTLTVPVKDLYMVSEMYKIPTVMLRYAHTQGSCTVSHCYNFIFKVLMLQG